MGWIMAVPGKMEYTITEKGKYAIVAMSGPVNALHTPRLRTSLHDLMKKEFSVFIIDFAGVNYMDSSGIATLVEAYQLAHEKGARLVLSSVHHEHVQHLFEITRLNDLFDFYDSPEAAMETLK
jgi:anti-sigma B factor antagonist